MKLAFMYNTLATVWFPVNSNPLNKQVAIPALSVIRIRSAGCAGDGTIIADGHGFSLHIRTPHPGNINFFSDGKEPIGYKPFDPTTAEELVTKN